jgi:hypothetical protein
VLAIHERLIWLSAVAVAINPAGTVGLAIVTVISFDVMALPQNGVVRWTR